MEKREKQNQNVFVTHAVWDLISYTNNSVAVFGCIRSMQFSCEFPKEILNHQLSLEHTFHTPHKALFIWRWEKLAISFAMTNFLYQITQKCSFKGHTVITLITLWDEKLKSGLINTSTLYFCCKQLSTWKKCIIYKVQIEYALFTIIRSFCVSSI